MAMKQSDNELLTQIGPGTRMGNLMRRYWWPVGFTERVADEPVPVRILGEDLVLFRNTQGKLGLLGPLLRAPPRLARTGPRREGGHPLLLSRLALRHDRPMPGDAGRGAGLPTDQGSENRRLQGRGTRRSASSPIWARIRRRCCRATISSCATTSTAKCRPRSIIATGCSAPRTASIRITAWRCTRRSIRRSRSSGHGTCDGRSTGTASARSSTYSETVKNTSHFIFPSHTRRYNARVKERPAHFLHLRVPVDDTQTFTFYAKGVETWRARAS